MSKSNPSQSPKIEFFRDGECAAARLFVRSETGELYMVISEGSVDDLHLELISELPEQKSGCEKCRGLYPTEIGPMHRKRVEDIFIKSRNISV